MIVNRCDTYTIARLQRKSERSQGLTDRGTAGYEKQGCYDCDGMDSDCRAYGTEMGLGALIINDTETVHKAKRGEKDE